MQRFITILILLLISGSNIIGQVKDQELLDVQGNITLLGKTSYKRLKKAPFKEWFLENERKYQYNPTEVASLKTQLTKVDSITVFMGTWCGDSKKEVPRLTRTLKEAGYDFEKVKIICLDRRFNFYKQSPQHEEAGLNIHRVPTIILHNKSGEIGRIVEHPITSIESDLLTIIGGSYTPNYEVVDKVDMILKLEGFRHFIANQDQYLTELKPYASKSSALTTYARILLTTWRIAEAIAVLEFNQKLFPESEYAHLHLASTYIMTGQQEAATDCCRKTLAINPESQTAKGMLKRME